MFGGRLLGKKTFSNANKGLGNSYILSGKKSEFDWIFWGNMFSRMSINPGHIIIATKYLVITNDRSNFLNV